MNILDIKQETSELDLDYFRQLIQSKVEKNGQDSYLEQLAKKQMGQQDVDPEEELSNAIDEIRKYEKEMNMIAVVAQTLFEKTGEFKQKIGEQQDSINEFESSVSQANQKYKKLQEEYEEVKQRMDKQDVLKDEMNKQIRSLTEKNQRQEKKIAAAEKKYSVLEEEASKKDQKYYDLEFKFQQEKKVLDSQILEYEEKLNQTQKSLDKINQQYDEKEKKYFQLKQKEENMHKKFQECEYEIKNLEKKYSKSKKYVQDLENQIIKQEEKIKMMKMQKKNDDLCSQFESNAGGGLANELYQIEQADDSPVKQNSKMLSYQQVNFSQKSKNLLDQEFDLEPERVEVQEFDEFENNQEFYNQQKNSFLQAEGLNLNPANDIMNQDYNVYEYQEKQYSNNNSFAENQMNDNDMFDQNDQPVFYNEQNYVQIQGKQLVEQECQTFINQVESQCQTELISKSAITQTNKVETNDEDCQTDGIQTYNQALQADIKPLSSDVSTEPDQSILQKIQIELEKQIRQEYEMTMQQFKMQRQSSKIPMQMDSSGGQQLDGSFQEEFKQKTNKPPKTVRNATIKIDFDDKNEKSSLEDESLQYSFKDQSNYEYLMKRDPMQEFFALTCQSIKLNSPHMNTICTIDTNQLYKQAIKMSIPFFKWQTWIEDYLNKELLRSILMSKSKAGQKQTDKKTFEQAHEMTKKKIMDQVKYFQNELEEHNGIKNQNIKKNIQNKPIVPQISEPQHQQKEPQNQQAPPVVKKKVFKGLGLFK